MPFVKERCATLHGSFRRVASLLLFTIVVARDQEPFSYMFDLGNHIPEAPFKGGRRMKRAYALSFPETEDQGESTLLYELSGTLAPRSFLGLDVYVYKHSKCEQTALKLIDKCEVVLNSNDILASAGPCDFRSRLPPGVLPKDAEQALIPSLVYDRDNDAFVRDIDNQFVSTERSLMPDTMAKSFKLAGFDTLYRTPLEECKKM